MNGEAHVQSIFQIVYVPVEALVIFTGELNTKPEI
jgi:hypothetical protein